MANNYNQATVQPSFPISSVTEFEKELLEKFGFSCETHGSSEGELLYFFLEDSYREEIEDLELDLVYEFAQKGDSIAVKLLEYIQDHGSDDLDAYVSNEFQWESILQQILKKPECEGVEDICIEGAYTCDKLRPGEFGGWVCRITRDSVQHDGTSAAFQRMQKEPEFLAALDIVWQLASGNCLEDDLVDDDPDLLEEQSRQKKALALIHDYVVNHPLAG